MHWEKGITANIRELSGRVLDRRPRCRGFKPVRGHCVVSLSININPSLVLVQPRKTRPYITERLMMGCKESNQTNISVPSKRYVACAPIWMTQISLCTLAVWSESLIGTLWVAKVPMIFHTGGEDSNQTKWLIWQGSHRLEKCLNLEGFLEKNLKSKSALKI